MTHAELNTANVSDGSRKALVNDLTGAAVPVAFAVWNGSAGDRDGKKSVTIWQELLLEK